MVSSPGNRYASGPMAQYGNVACMIRQYIANLGGMKSKTIPQCITIIQIIHFLFSVLTVKFIKVFGCISTMVIQIIIFETK